MAWSIELDPRAERDLDKLDPQVARRILSFLYNRVVRLDDPRTLGEALQGAVFGQYWRYRVGDYRLICLIQDEVLLVTVVKIGHRREVYRTP